jgi:hypothetical protein
MKFRVREDCFNGHSQFTPERSEDGTTWTEWFPSGSRDSRGEEILVVHRTGNLLAAYEICKREWMKTRGPVYYDFVPS